MPSEVTAAILGADSLPNTVSNEGAHGYLLTGDLDNLAEPLLYGEPISTSSITPASSQISPIVSRPPN